MRLSSVGTLPMPLHAVQAGAANVMAGLRGARVNTSKMPQFSQAPFRSTPQFCHGPIRNRPPQGEPAEARTVVVAEVTHEDPADARSQGGFGHAGWRYCFVDGARP